MLAPKGSDDQARVSTAPGTLEVFIARAEARALLCAACEVTLHEGVDQLQIAAERDGIAADIGQDAVQAIMAQAFASGCENFASLSTRADETKEIRGPDGDGVAFAAAANDEYAGLSFSFAAACREADEKQRPKPVDQAIERARRLLTDDVALESAWHEISRRDTAAVSTVEALVYALRTDGTAAIATNRMRLLELSPKQLENVIVRLSRMRPAHPSINDHLLELLTELLP